MVMTTSPHAAVRAAVRACGVSVVCLAVHPLRVHCGAPQLSPAGLAALWLSMPCGVRRSTGRRAQVRLVMILRLSI